jgi:hypothetical protein
MARRLTTILLVLLVAAGVMTTAVGADPTYTVPVLAQTVDAGNPGDVPDGMTVVFLPAAGDGFSDGGDGPGGLEWVMGFSDGGDSPVGYIEVAAEPAGDAFWREHRVPDGMTPVLGFVPGEGFSDGGDLPDGFVRVLFRSVDLRGPGN